MNKYIENLIRLGVVIGGKMTKEDVFVVFQRMSEEELSKINESELAFATKAMGRAIFAMQENKIINYKGVDSHLKNEEIATKTLVSAEACYIPKRNLSYEEDQYPLNLMLFLGNRPDIRIRGASPLEDLEIEAEVNSKMQGKGIKLPKIEKVVEFTEEFLEKYELPINVDGSFEEFSSDYKKEYQERKKYLKETMGEDYKEEIIPGKRPETLSEYLKRMKITEHKNVRIFLEETGLSLKDFSNYVDNIYSLGQRYGQTKRQIQNPFRIADLEYYIQNNDVEILESIAEFSESLQETKEPMENYFAKQMGKNLGNMMNNGWRCENFSHRQDYTLAGEMCDDSYVHLPEELEKAEKYDKCRREYHILDEKKKYLYQIYALSSNIKILMEEMKLRGKSENEIDTVFSDFTNNFYETLDLEKVSSFIGKDAHKAIEILVKVPKNYENILAQKMNENGTYLEQEILFSQKGNNEFFNRLSSDLAKKYGIQRTFIEPKRKDMIVEELEK